MYIHVVYKYTELKGLAAFYSLVKSKYTILAIVGAQREREREKEGWERGSMCVCVCVCVCTREGVEMDGRRERKRFTHFNCEREPSKFTSPNDDSFDCFYNTKLMYTMYK